MARKKRTATLKEDFMAFVLEGTMEKARKYLHEGRQFESLNSADLRSQWISAYKKLAASLTNPESLKLVDDLQAEMEIRRIEPPYDDVKAEAEAITAYATRAEHLRLEDLQADIDAVKAKRDSSAKN